MLSDLFIHFIATDKDLINRSVKRGTNMDIFAALRNGHEKQRLLMKVLVETTGDSASRRDFFFDLKF